MIILDRKDRDKLGERHDQFMRGEVTSFVCVVVMNDGTTHVDFDLVDAQDERVMNKMGGGLDSAYRHLVELARERRLKTDFMNKIKPAADVKIN
jgi:hypothetical protein